MDEIVNLDGLSHILGRLEPSLIFCDADVLPKVKEVCATIGVNAKLFTVNGTEKGHDSLDVLMSGNATEDDFVYVLIVDSAIFQCVNYFCIYLSLKISYFQLYGNKRSIFTCRIACLFIRIDGTAEIDLYVAWSTL